jgi:hypothetical protein
VAILYHLIRHHIPEDLSLHRHCCENSRRIFRQRGRHRHIYRREVYGGMNHVPATCAYSEPEQSGPHSPILFIEDEF